MSEPAASAERLETVAPGLLHWSVHDERIGARSDAWAITDGRDTVAIDPLPLAAEALRALGRMRAVVLTIQSHQRSAWKLRKRFGAMVWAPRGAEGLEERPDQEYGEGAVLPLSLRGFHAPGPCEASCALLWERPGEPGVLFVGDLLVASAGGGLGFVPDEYQEAPGRTRESVRRLSALPFQTVCSGHAPPLLTGGPQALRDALAGAAGR